MVERVRETDRYVPELTYVAEDGGGVVGQVMLSEFDVEGVPRRVLQLGPVAVEPGRQREGIGSALIRRALADADERREPLVLLEGDPAYYSRFGFRRASEHGLLPPEGVPDWALQVLLLHGYDPAIRGRVVYPPAFK